MSRHRNVRNFAIEDELADYENDEYYEDYSHSPETTKLSPSTEQYLYKGGGAKGKASANPIHNIIVEQVEAKKTSNKAITNKGANNNNVSAGKGKGKGKTSTASTTSTAAFDPYEDEPEGFYSSRPLSKSKSQPIDIRKTDGNDSKGGSAPKQKEHIATTALNNVVAPTMSTPPVAPIPSDEKSALPPSLSSDSLPPLSIVKPLRSASSEAAQLAAAEEIRLAKLKQAEEKGTEASTLSSARLTVDSSSSSFSVSPNPSAPSSPRPPAEVPIVKLSKEKQHLIDSESKKDTKPSIHMVVIGQVDHGKSTLMGHLLLLTGRVNSKLIHKYEKESKEMNKSSFHFAWVLDEQEEERSRGITVEVATNWFETKSKLVTLLDAPGHRDFIPSMISGAAQADCAILVVAAVTGEFEGGFVDEGQTKEHSILARALGVSQIIVAVNKLDQCDWSESRYNEILSVLLPFLKSAGFKESSIFPCPVSGLTGENIVESKEAKLKQWYNGPTLIDLIDHFSVPVRSIDKPFRMSVNDVYRMQSNSATVGGKIECGVIIPRDTLLLLPPNEIVTVKGIECHQHSTPIGKAGDNVELTLKDMSNIGALQIGQWLCDPNYPIPCVQHFRCQILTMQYKIPLLAGTTLMMYTQANCEPVVLHKLISILDRSTGLVSQEAPRALPRGASAVVDIKCNHVLCIEQFSRFKELGRFSLRRDDQTVAVGIVTKLFKLKTKTG